eukprot:TRINITY_DN1335_c0_g1_i2.p2 TRINITY_DN1335_c0_g1~~TRINITY_DN1335_c0_g1_i2.p2  ORF type:complete len:239 (+),score=17.13 TRINITY_DN1335_c0_g1_i2:274-990(+)
MYSVQTLNKSNLFTNIATVKKCPKVSVVQDQQRPYKLQRVCTRVTSPTERQAASSVKIEESEDNTLGPWWTRDQPDNMIDAESVQELVDILASSGDKLVIVDFYATWCNACRALYPKLVKICNQHSEDLIVVKINWQENKAICKPLGIKVLPFFHFYRGVQGRVASFSASITKLQKLKDAVAEHVSPRCQLSSLQEPLLQEFPDVRAASVMDVAGNVVSFRKGDEDSESTEEKTMMAV